VPIPSRMAERYGPETPVPEWRVSVAAEAARAGEARDGSFVPVVGAAEGVSPFGRATIPIWCDRRAAVKTEGSNPSLAVWSTLGKPPFLKVPRSNFDHDFDHSTREGKRLLSRGTKTVPH